jgi:hypothetical protein
MLQIAEENAGKKGRCSFCQWLFIIQPPAPPPSPTQYQPAPQFYQQPQFSPPPQFYPNKVQTIEKTGKKYKAQMLLSIFLIINAILLWGLTGGRIDRTDIKPYCTLAVFVGGLWFIFAKIATWWHHG